MKKTYMVKMKTLADTFEMIELTFSKEITIFDYFVYQEKMYWITEVSGFLLEAIEQEETIHFVEENVFKGSEKRMSPFTNEQILSLAKAYQEIDRVTDELESERPDRQDCKNIYEVWIQLRDLLEEILGENVDIEEWIAANTK